MVANDSETRDLFTILDPICKIKKSWRKDIFSHKSHFNHTTDLSSDEITFSLHSLFVALWQSCCHYHFSRSCKYRHKLISSTLSATTRSKCVAAPHSTSCANYLPRPWWGYCSGEARRRFWRRMPAARGLFPDIMQNGNSQVHPSPQAHLKWMEILIPWKESVKTLTETGSTAISKRIDSHSCILDSYHKHDQDVNNACIRAMVYWK